MTTETETLICDVHGPFTQKEFYGRRCPKCQDEYWEKRDRENEARAAQARLNAAHIPSLFQGKLLDDFEAETPAQQKVLRVAKDYAYRFPEHYDDGRGLIMLGNVGTGKTMLSCAIVQTLTNTEFPFPCKEGNQEHSGRSGFFYTALYTTASAIIRTVRDTWGAKESSTDAIKRFVRADLLVIDEIGASVGSDSERSLLFEIIDLRYGATRPTVAVTNCDPSGLTAVLGARAVDRLRDHDADVCVFDWKSKRRWKR